MSLVAFLGLPCAWPEEAFKVPAGNYVRVSYIPNIVTRRALRGSDAHRRLMLVQVDVFVATPQDAAVGIELAGKVAEHFPADYKMRYSGTTVRVRQAPSPAQALPGTGHTQYPVMIDLETLQ